MFTFFCTEKKCFLAYVFIFIFLCVYLDNSECYSLINKQSKAIVYLIQRINHSLESVLFHDTWLHNGVNLNGSEKLLAHWIVWCVFFLCKTVTLYFSTEKKERWVMWIFTYNNLEYPVNAIASDKDHNVYVVHDLRVHLNDSQHTSTKCPKHYHIFRHIVWSTM